MPRDPFSGPCSRCGREIDSSREEAALVGDPAALKRVCHECVEREERQRAAFCRICEHEVENPEGLEGPVCTECHGLYLTISWDTLDRLCRSEDWDAIKRYLTEPGTDRLDYRTRVRLTNLRLAVIRHEEQQLTRFPMVVRPRRT